MATRANSRFTDIGGGLAAEMISDSIQITYDPTTQKCRVLFTGHNYIKPADKYLPIGIGSDVLDVDLTPYMTTRPVPEEFGLIDPVTGINLSNVSIVGMVYFIKFVYDMFHNLRDQQLKAGSGDGSLSRPPNALPPSLLD
ncbi:hypothetical protein [Stenotrophomonas sp. GD03657]|uniref:hypothetical protein n=1 Tax=Stenotrophomonas sp. GD03657 TaxID=2975363 RepID=UPI00244D0F09|nr:hypothetical protein [Stenotrophomonas sp. GD03657]MDH2154235.1 hypothetical protein [Stenotrophomonas sp. GD03657]